MDSHVLPELAGCAHSLASSQVERTHLLVGMGKDDAAGSRQGLAIAVPAINQIGARCLACERNVKRFAPSIGVDRFCGSAGGELARGFLLPVITLPANLGDLPRAMTFGNRAKRCAGLDRLQLLGVPDQHDLGAALFSL
jgi:hypothetical protein